jgi:hypothetical protein
MEDVEYPYMSGDYRLQVWRLWNTCLEIIEYRSGDYGIPIQVRLQNNYTGLEIIDTHTGLEIIEHPYRPGDYRIIIQVWRLCNNHTRLEIIEYPYRSGVYRIIIQVWRL